MKVLVIGAVAGGPSFATRLRRLDESIEIIMLERGANISYASCALPYYLGGVIDDRDSLIERTPESLKIKNNLDVRIFNEVTKIDPQAKAVSVTNLKTNESYVETYDKLVISAGARPVFPQIDGLAEANNAFVLRSVSDADAIKNFMEQENPQKVTILGAGIAGLELAENFKHRGMAVTLVEQLPQVAYTYDQEIADILYEKLIAEDIRVFLGETATEISENGRKLRLADGQEIEQEMLIFATGVKPNNEVAAAAGIALAADQHIIVDDQLRTNIADIYAIGDVIETTSVITGLPIPSLLSSAANRQGHLLADIFVGNPLRYRGFIGSGVGKVFDLTASFVGYTEAMLKAVGITNYKTIFITPFDHAYFYPGATRLNLKLIFDADSGKILGGQAVGEKGVDKRIGELSVAITGNLSVFDLPDLELPYSPPYSTTRDPLNTAGYVAINQLSNVAATIKLADIPEADFQTAFFLDIREAGKAATGSVTATANIPLSELRERLTEVPTDQRVYLTFRKGLNNYNAARILAGAGIQALIIEE
ncbi:FAD-dependent oxidoreductase [Enterococcus sp. LJL120]